MSIQLIKTWFREHVHTPEHGDGQVSLHISQVLHDSRFWVLLLAGALIAMFILMAILAGGGNGSEPRIPQSPMFPYVY